jgi:O-antigen/teichoic acid export membrane protein
MDIPFSGRVKDLKVFFSGGGTKQKIFNNFFWLGFSEFVSRLLKLVLIIYVARILGATEYGKFTFAMAFAGIFFIFSDMGLSQIATREFAADPKKQKDLPHLVSLQSFLIFSASLLIFASSFLITSDPQIRVLIWVLGLVTMSESFMSLALSFFQATQRMQYLAMVKIFEASAVTLAGFYVIFNFPSVFGLSLGYLFGAALTAFFLFCYLFRGRYGIIFSPNVSVWKEYFKLSWPLALNSLFVTIYMATDSIMMGYLGQITETGWYNAAQRVVGVSLIPINLASVAFFPALSGFFKESKEKFQRIWDFYLNSVFFFALPILFGGIALAPRIISFAYGQGYSQSVLAFQILLVMAFVNMISAPFSQVLIIFNRQKSIFWVTLFGAILNVSLNVIFIPKYSLYGAAGATVATFFAVLLLLIVLVAKAGGLKIFKMDLLICFLAALFSSVAMFLLVSNPRVYELNILFSILIGFVAYVVLFSVCLAVAKLFKRQAGIG